MIKELKVKNKNISTFNILTSLSSLLMRKRKKPNYQMKDLFFFSQTENISKLWESKLMHTPKQTFHKNPQPQSSVAIIITVTQWTLMSNQILKV